MAHTRRLIDHIILVADELIDYAADRKNARTMINLIDTNVRLKYNTVWGSWFLGQLLKYARIRVREGELNDIVASLNQCDDPLLFLKSIIIFTDHGGWGPTSVNTNFMYEWVSKLKVYQQADPDPSLVLTSDQVEYLRNVIEEKVKVRETEIKFLKDRQQARKEELASLPKTNIQLTASELKKDFEPRAKPAENTVRKLDLVKFNEVTSVLSGLFQARMTNLGNTKKIIIPTVQEHPFQEIPMKEEVVIEKLSVQEEPFADIPMIPLPPTPPNEAADEVIKSSKPIYQAPQRKKLDLSAGHLATLEGLFARRIEPDVKLEPPKISM